MSEIRFSVIGQLDQLEIVLEGSRIPSVAGGSSTSRTPLSFLIPSVKRCRVRWLKPINCCRSAMTSSPSRIRRMNRQRSQQQRDQLLAQASIRQEAERRATEMREQIRQQCEQLLQTTVSRLRRWNRRCRPSRLSLNSSPHVSN